MRFRCARRTPEYVAWMFEKEINAELSDEEEYVPNNNLTDEEVLLKLGEMTTIEKLHMLNFERFKQSSKLMLKSEKIIKIEVHRQFGNVRVYIYPERGRMEFVSCILKDADDHTRLQKIFTLVLKILENCYCENADIMINLGCMQSEEFDQPTDGSSRVLPRLALPVYKIKFPIGTLYWQFDGPLQFYHQLSPRTTHFHGPCHTPGSAEELCKKIHTEVKAEVKKKKQEAACTMRSFCCIALFCIAPVIVLLIMKVRYEQEGANQSFKILSKMLFENNGESSLYWKSKENS